MTAGRPKAPLVLAEEERLQIRSIASSRSLSHALVHRARLLLVGAYGLSHAGIGETRPAPPAVHRIWQAFGLQPHRQRHFKLSTDPFFVEKVRDIVGLYLQPPDKSVVLCVAETAQIQALERS